MQHRNIIKLLGDKAACYLDHACTTIDKKMIHTGCVPG